MVLRKEFKVMMIKIAKDIFKNEIRKNSLLKVRSRLLPFVIYQRVEKLAGMLSFP